MTTPPDWADIAHREHQLRLAREAEVRSWQGMCNDAITAIRAVRELHRADLGSCGHCVDGYGNLVAAPCPTIQVLDRTLLTAWGLNQDEPPTPKEQS